MGTVKKQTLHVQRLFWSAALSLVPVMSAVPQTAPSLKKNVADVKLEYALQTAYGVDPLRAFWNTALSFMPDILRPVPGPVEDIVDARLACELGPARAADFLLEEFRNKSDESSIETGNLPQQSWKEVKTLKDANAFVKDRSNPSSRNLIISLFNIHDDYQQRISGALGSLNNDAFVVQLNIAQEKPKFAVAALCSAIEKRVREIRKDDPNALLNDIVIITHGDNGVLSFNDPKGMNQIPPRMSGLSGNGFKADYHIRNIDVHMLLQAMVGMKQKLMRKNASGVPVGDGRFCRVLAFGSCSMFRRLSDSNLAFIKDYAGKLNCTISASFTKVWYGDQSAYGNMVDVRPDGTLSRPPSITMKTTPYLDEPDMYGPQRPLDKDEVTAGAWFLGTAQKTTQIKPQP